MATGTSLESNYVMVAAIDFGTTFSGYAFSFKSAKEEIKVNKNWGEVFGFQSIKAPTTVLIKDNGEFIDFGYEAEHKFVHPDDEDEDDDSSDDNNSVEVEKHLYRHFKMILHSTKKLTTSTVVASTTGKARPAIDIFTHALRYLKDHLLNEVSKQVTDSPSAAMIRWVITVPAIWSDESKQFMREAAFRSGCIRMKESKQLIIALEPEAASFFCRQLSLAKLTSTTDVSFPSGTQYLVLDCGGGTNDMVVHEIIRDSEIKELCAVTGGSYGGIKIEERFTQLLRNKLGEEFINAFQEKHPEQWFLFKSRFELAKKAVKDDGRSTINVDLPFSMPSMYSEMYPGKKLEKVLTGMASEGVTFSTGLLILRPKVVKELFDETAQGIVNGVKDILAHPKIRHIDYIFMVGGFSECSILQKAIKNEFGKNGSTVLIPSEAQLAIIRGAVLYGYYQDQIKSRIARKTYGVAVSRAFDPKIHKTAYKYTNADSEVLCGDIFMPLILKDEEIAIGTEKITSLHVPSNVVVGTLEFYSLSRLPHEPVDYIHAPDMTKMGRIIIQTPEDSSIETREILVTFTFGYTELFVEAKSTSALSRRFSTSFNFLSD